MTPTHSRMARAALRWTIEDLATRAGLAPNTVLTFEKGEQVRDSSVQRIRGAFEGADVRFLEKGTRMMVSIEKGSGLQIQG